MSDCRDGPVMRQDQVVKAALSGAARPEPASRMVLNVGERVLALEQPHMLVLERYREELAAGGRRVPHFDPSDAGDRARCLILLETPGPSEAPIRFVSRDNATGTARNLTRFCEAAALARKDTVLWNVVPWVIHAPGAQNRAPSRTEWQEGVGLLATLLPLLPRLQVIVFAGRMAQRAIPLVQSRESDLLLIPTAHPSPVYVNTSPAIAPRIISAFRQASLALT